ncbi:hypothetical protein GE09DRAFT_319453 [Coniochaeta sp. 2T2.1]|nr:hypothetical protein GE09DRAFT_319453 [Coniochaeta sp. 2T2.1]
MSVQPWIAAATALLSAYATAVSIASFPKLQKYEDKAKRAAEWSEMADKRLWDTRYTVGAGFVTASTSSLSALYHTVFVPRPSGMLVVGWPILMASAAIYVQRYMRSFWDSKAKIPLLDDYNEAISDTKTVIDTMTWISIGWVAVALSTIGAMFSAEASLPQ